MKRNGKKPKPNGSPKQAEEQAESTPQLSPSPADRVREYQWKPGQSGNPKGRPPKPSLVDAITRALNDAQKMADDGFTRKDADGRTQRPPTIDEVAVALLEMCTRGDREAAMMLPQLLERLDGKVPAKHEHTGKDGEAITVRSAREDIAGRIAGQIAKGRAAGDPTVTH